MSMKSALLASILASFFAMSANAQTTPAAAPEAKPAETMKAEKPAAAASAAKKSPAMDKSKHYHPRDGGKN